jgi:hypothetical protein
VLRFSVVEYGICGQLWRRFCAFTVVREDMEEMAQSGRQELTARLSQYNWWLRTYNLRQSPYKQKMVKVHGDMDMMDETHQHQILSGRSKSTFCDLAQSGTLMMR